MFLLHIGMRSIIPTKMYVWHVFRQKIYQVYRNLALIVALEQMILSGFSYRSISCFHIATWLLSSESKWIGEIMIANSICKFITHLWKTKVYSQKIANACQLIWWNTFLAISQRMKGYSTCYNTITRISPVLIALRFLKSGKSSHQFILLSGIIRHF